MSESGICNRTGLVELKGDKQTVLAALDQFLDFNCSGRIGFDKEGAVFFMWATSENEPTS